MALSDVPGDYYTNQDLEFFFEAESEFGLHYYPVTTHLLIPVKTGSPTEIFFYSDLAFGQGDVQISDITLSIAYFPTAYGTVTLPQLPGGGNLRSEMEEGPFAKRLAEAENRKMSNGEIVEELERLRRRIEKLQNQIEGN